MRPPKSMFLQATLGWLLSIVWLAVGGVGCSNRVGISEDRFQKAEELVNVGTELLRRRKLKDADKAYELASELAPLAAAFDGRGCVALLENRFGEAEEYFFRAYDMDASYDEVLLNLGLLYQRKGDNSQARAIYLDYLRKWPESVRARNDLAALEYDLGRGKMEIVNELEKALALEEHNIIKANIGRLDLP